MSNRKPATASKRSGSPKTAAKTTAQSQRTKVAARAQRTKQSLVRSPKDDSRHTAPSLAELPAAHHSGSEREAPKVEQLSHEVNQMVRGADRKIGIDLPSATSTVRALRARFLGVAQANMQLAQANMQFAFEFSGRLASMRSPFEIPGVIAEFTGKRIEIVRKYSQSIVELNRVN